MELRQLAYFLAVAEEANFTRAAERVRISQSGISAQVRALETALGAQLFDRSGRIARLTAAGAAALPYAKNALESAESLRQAVDEVNGLVRGELTIGMITGCEVTPLFTALAGFRREHPTIDVELVEDASSALISRVMVSETDIALVGVAGEPPEHLESQVLASEGLVALAPPGSAPGRDGRVELIDLIEHPLITLPEGTGIRTAFDEACLDAMLIPDVALVASAPGAVAQLAESGLGIAVLSESMAASFPGLVPVAIDGITLPALLALVWRKKPSPALTALLPHLRAAFRTEAEGEKTEGPEAGKAGTGTAGKRKRTEGREPAAERGKASSEDIEPDTAP